MCSRGVCVDHCAPGETSGCGGGECLDLESDPNNCGGCDVLCPSGTVCSGGVCS